MSIDWDDAYANAAYIAGADKIRDVLSMLGVDVRDDVRVYTRRDGSIAPLPEVEIAFVVK
ncbi:MAG: hypothetical protein JKY34_13640, partial [Kordiimonadaceae bacterium]|nr:hypothetical protein [Kordiimonadaceae bacterium]